MPVPYSEALDETCAQAADKAAALRSPVRYGALSALAGAYVGVAVVLLLSVAGPLAAGGSPATKLVQGAVFGVALTLVVFAGAELFTGNNMTMLIGAVVHGSGVLGIHSPGKPAPAKGLLGTIVAGKLAETDGQLFWRAVLC